MMSKSLSHEVIKNLEATLTKVGVESVDSYLRTIDFIENIQAQLEQIYECSKVAYGEYRQINLDNICLSEDLDDEPRKDNQ